MVFVLLIAAVRKNWLQRWFVLDFVSGDLAYFENKQVSSICKVSGTKFDKNVCLQSIFVGFL